MQLVFRPQILILCKTDSDLNIKYPKLISFAGQLRGGQGLVILSSLIEGDYADKEVRERALKVKEVSTIKIRVLYNLDLNQI